MNKIVKIEVGDSWMADIEYGSKIARFTYDDGGHTFILADAFPSTEVMIRDCNANPVVSGLLAAFKGADSGEKKYAESVQQWEDVWSVNDKSTLLH